MARYIITGGKKLEGTIRISGNKNSVLPCLAACLLTEDEVTLTNVPSISDVAVFKSLLESLGSFVKEQEESITVSTPKITTHRLDPELTTKLRGSVLMAGPLLARIGKVELSHPGGDIIGKRAIDIHLNGFSKLGYSVKIDDASYSITRQKKVTDLSLFLEVPSVTGTENLVLASVLGDHTVTLKNCAGEPHVVDLCNLLNEMGASITGIGSSTLCIKGVKKLHGATFRIGSDSTEVGTYIALAAITKGNLTLKNVFGFDLDAILWPFKKMGIEIDTQGETLKISKSTLKAIPTLTTGFWPNFPTDLMSIMIVLSTQSKGVSLMRDWIYESRMFFADKLVSMGANITIADPHRVLVYGPTDLVGRNLESPDIRAGMALVLAALVATGTSIINKADHIERGYTNVVENLKSLGAEIERVD